MVALDYVNETHLWQIWGTFINEEPLVKLLIYLSMFLYNQSKLTTSAKKKFKRAAPILLRCSLLLFREEFFILLLSIRRKTFPLHSFIFLILIIRWKTLDKRILTLSLIAFSLLVVITFLIFCVVLILFVTPLTPFLFYWEVVLT